MSFVIAAESATSMDLGLLQLFMDTGEPLGIPRFVRHIAVVPIAVKRDAVFIL
ncbi:hypothetical protein GsuE55_09320 [Geobacillus subterraneus]|uniref:Uncharacterized protein n=1 Tax=Geobacillus subterraneus TaxID=129338 RepID=A0A679FMC6_9BACL|nr:hypothetical protein GsuE55_09320 [Geobacillus subterraneus]